MRSNLVCCRVASEVNSLILLENYIELTDSYPELTLYTDGSGRVFRLVGGGGCGGCLLLLVGWFAFSFLSAFGANIYYRYFEKRANVPTVVLDSYAGEYDYLHRYEISVRRRDDVLLSASPEAICILTPVSSKEFAYRTCSNGFKGRAKFIKDDKGKFVLVIVHQDGREESAPRVIYKR